MTAMFDTGCQGPNGVSYELIAELGMEDKIWRPRKAPTSSGFINASGQSVPYKGTVELSWQHYDEKSGHKYKKIRRDDFNILPSNHIQIIFGEPYCRENNLLRFNTSALNPLMSDERMPSGTLISNLKYQINKADKNLNPKEMQNQINANRKRREEKKKEADKERVKIESIDDSSSIPSKAVASREQRSVESTSIQRCHS